MYKRQRLARENIKTFIDNGVKKILVSSPHCYHTFKNEYPEFMVNFEVIHISQYLFELINEGRLELNKEYRRQRQMCIRDRLSSSLPSLISSNKYWEI